MDNKDNFNSATVFEKELVKILTNLLTDKLKRFLRCSVEEHDIQPIKELLRLIDEHKVYEETSD